MSWQKVSTAVFTAAIGYFRRYAPPWLYSSIMEPAFCAAFSPSKEGKWFNRRRTLYTSRSTSGLQNRISRINATEIPFARIPKQIRSLSASGSPMRYENLSSPIPTP